MNFTIPHVPPRPEAGASAPAEAAAPDTPPALSTRPADETPLAHVPTGRSISFQRYLLSRLAGTLAGSVPRAVGNAVAAASLAGVQHTPMHQALQQAGIATGYNVAALLVASGLVSVATYKSEKNTAGQDVTDQSSLEDWQLRTAIVAAVAASIGGSALEFDTVVAAQRTVWHGELDIGQTLKEAAVSGAVSGALATAGVVAAYASSDRVARASKGLAARGLQFVRNAYRSGRDGADRYESGPAQEFGLAPQGPQAPHEEPRVPRRGTFAEPPEPGDQGPTQPASA